MITLVQGDCRDLLPTLPPNSVQCIVTSPPYFLARDYGDPRQIGHEPTPAAYVAALLEVFRACRRVLRDDGVLWLNLGDCYAQDTKWGGSSGGKNTSSVAGGYLRRRSHTGLPDKNLIGIPWRVAFALQDDGWFLRNEIIWEKPNGMPESVKDRLTVGHETIFLLSKQHDYSFDVDAIREEAVTSDRSAPKGARGGRRRSAGARKQAYLAATTNHRYANLDAWEPTPLRRKRTVWRCPTANSDVDHYAVFPEALVEPCILAGSRPGDTVLDPFGGSGTTGRVAERLGRSAVLIDLNDRYLAIAEQRTSAVQLAMDAYL
jgi:DNA modification methylase